MSRLKRPRTSFDDGVDGGVDGGVNGRVDRYDTWELPQIADTETHTGQSLDCQFFDTTTAPQTTASCVAPCTSPPAPWLFRISHPHGPAHPRPAHPRPAHPRTVQSSHAATCFTPPRSLCTFLRQTCAAPCAEKGSQSPWTSSAFPPRTAAATTRS